MTMLAFVHGSILSRGKGYVIVRSGDLGYKISVSEERAQSLTGEVSLFTHEVVREDGRELFGFLDVEELEVFWTLIGVSGIGPKGAQRILASTSLSELKTHLMQGDVAFLSSIPGIGKKTAQKLILELKGVLVEETSVSSEDHDVLLALTSMGYTAREVEQVLRALESRGVDARIREALQRLGGYGTP